MYKQQPAHTHIHTFQFDGTIFMSEVKTLEFNGRYGRGGKKMKKEEFTYTFCNSFRWGIALLPLHYFHSPHMHTTHIIHTMFRRHTHIWDGEKSDGWGTGRLRWKGIANGRQSSESTWRVNWQSATNSQPNSIAIDEYQSQQGKDEVKKKNMTKNKGKKRATNRRRTSKCGQTL